MKKREQKKLIKLLLSLIVIVCIVIVGYFRNDIYEVINDKQVVTVRNTRNNI